MCVYIVQLLYPLDFFPIRSGTSFWHWLHMGTTPTFDAVCCRRWPWRVGVFNPSTEPNPQVGTDRWETVEKIVGKKLREKAYRTVTGHPNY